MADYKLEASAREVIGKKVKLLRLEGQIPGIIYGPKTPPVPIAMDVDQLDDVLVAAGGTALVEVAVGKDAHQVLVRSVDRDIIRGDLMHVDFYAVDLTQVTQVEVPIVLVGEAPITLTGEGVLQQQLTSVLVEGLPSDLIHEILVELEDLTEVGMTITVSDLYVPDTITLLNDLEEIVVTITYPIAEEEEETIEDEDELSMEPELVGDDQEEDFDDEE